MQILSTKNEYIYTKPFKEGYTCNGVILPLQQDIYRKKPVFYSKSLFCSN